MPKPPDDTLRLKEAIRRQAHRNRRAQPDKDALSRAICERFTALPEYAAARTVLFYVDVRDEVCTRRLLSAALQSGKRAVVPYCTKDELRLFHLQSMDELAEGTFGILEPRRALRQLDRKRVDVADVDLVMVPGVALDRQGGRVGHGKGYYDKLLEHARPDTPLVAVAFECQLFSEVPTLPHDIYMDKVVTEKAVYQGKGRAGHCA